MSALPTSVRRPSAVPALRIHKASGQYIADFAGKSTYFGRDLVEAWTTFLPKLAEWRTTTGVQTSVTVWEAADRLSDRVATDNGHDSKLPTFSHLKPFCLVHGSRQIDSITVDDLEAYKSSLQAQEYAPKSVNHFMAAVKRMLRYSAFRGWRSPMELSFIRSVRQPSPPPKNISLMEVGEWLNKAHERQPMLALWLRVQLATAARPSEVIRLAHRQYTELEPGVVCFNVGKTNKRMKHPRCLVIPKALAADVAAMEPRWKSMSSVAQACSAAFGSGPHRLRHTAAFLIHRLPGEKVSRDDTDLFLGHYPSYVSLTYNPVDWTAVRALAERYFGYLQAAVPRHFPI